MSGSEKAMDYTRMQRSLLDHPKFLDLVEYLQEHGEKFTGRDVWGSLGMMWLNTATHYADGQIHDDHDVVRRIWRMSQWHGDPKIWVDALERVRFLDKNEDGYYVHNWMEKHARDWWLKNEHHERKRELDKARAQRWRDRRKEAAKELKFLKEKGVVYDASPPPSQSDRNAETTFVTRDDALRNVTQRDVTLRTFSGPAETPPATHPAEVEPEPENQKDLIINSVRETSVRHALRDVTQRASRDKRREEQSREETKDKDPRPDNAALTPIQTLVQDWFDHFETRTGKKSLARGGYIGAMLKRMMGRGYDLHEIDKRMVHFFKSTTASIVKKNFPPSLFQDKFDQLEKGPLMQPEDRNQGRFNGQYDKRADQFEVSDDFGTTGGDELKVEAGTGGGVPGK